MITEIALALAKGFEALAGFLGLQSKKIDLRNTPEVQKATEAQDEATEVDRTEKAVAGRNIDELRKEISE